MVHKLRNHRAFFIPLLLMVISVLFTGCGREDNLDWQGRKEIILATFRSDKLASELVSQFNRTNKEYYITIDVYWDGVCDDEGQMARKKFDATITNRRASRYPDIVLTTANHSYFRYAKRGAFIDLMPYLEADEELSREDLFEQVLDTLLVDEKQYGLPASFTMQALVMNKTAAASDRSLETISDFQKNADYSISALWDRVHNIHFWMLQYLDEFIDWQAGVCDFDDPRFISLLEMFDVIPEEYDVYKLLDAIRDNEPLFLNWEIRNIYDLEEFHYLFGGDMTITGLPGREEEINVYFSNIFSITRNSRNKQIAWDFISMSVSDKFQTGKMDRQDFHLTISRNVLEEFLLQHSEEKAWPIIRTTYIDNYVRYHICYLTQDTINSFLRLLDMKMTAVVYDYRLMDIILEEVNGYLGGQPLERTITNLNDRVGLYLKENR